MKKGSVFCPSVFIGCVHIRIPAVQAKLLQLSGVVLHRSSFGPERPPQEAHGRKARGRLQAQRQLVEVQQGLSVTCTTCRDGGGDSGQ